MGKKNVYVLPAETPAVGGHTFLLRALGPEQYKWLRDPLPVYGRQ